MLFKQAQLFSFNKTLPTQLSSLLPKLEPLIFKNCPPSFSSSHGWVAPTKESDAPLVYSMGHYLLFSLQFEEKVLPAGVIKKELETKINELQQKEDRKIYSKEKKNLRDEVTMTLLPRAFTQISQIYALIDTKRQWLITNTLQADKVKALTSSFKKCFDIDVTPLKLKKISYLLTQWVKQNEAPEGIEILDQCFLQDPNSMKRTIRSQSQSLSSPPLQALIESGLEVKQLMLSWQEAIKFTLTDFMHLKNLRYTDEALADVEDDATESALDRFNTDFVMMAKTLDALFLILTENFAGE
ncbi:MAG: recombination-associated protein RdgC [Gammaproteobacteria bacterium]|nr:recombination-associated protein RdgC [Gammaproteobacteria bacterium]